jgi:hypothetical protein
MTCQRCDVLAVSFVVAVALAACGGDGDSRVDTSDPTRATGATTTKTTDPPTDIAAWCVDWLELAMDPALFDAALDDETALVEIERLAQRGTDLPNPVIATASAEIVDYITWPERLGANADAQPPDWQTVTDAMAALTDECQATRSCL